MSVIPNISKQDVSYFSGIHHSIFYNIVKNSIFYEEFHGKIKGNSELPQKEPDEEPVPIIPSSYKELKAINMKNATKRMKPKNQSLKNQNPIRAI